MSERDGWNHLYLIDAHDGRGEEPDHAGRVGGAAASIASTTRSGRSGSTPAASTRARTRTTSTIARVNFDGTGLVVLTEGDGTHQVDYSPDRRFLIDTYSRVDLPPVTELRRADGRHAGLRAGAGRLVGLAGDRLEGCPSGSWPRGATARPTSTA